MNSIKDIAAFIADAVKDEDGRTSGMRLMSVVGVGVVILVWAYLSILHGALAVPSSELVAMFGLLIGGKVVQAHIENK